MGKGKNKRGGKGRNSRKGERKDKKSVNISKSLSWILRHGAVKEGIDIDEGGWVLLEDILKMKQEFKKVTEDEIRTIVKNCQKQRFQLKTAIPASTNQPELFIRATQGHTIVKINPEALLTAIKDVSEVPCAVHGSFSKVWKLIKSGGMKRMARNHMHFAPGWPGDDEVISGMR